MFLSNRGLTRHDGQEAGGQGDYRSEVKCRQWTSVLSGQYGIMSSLTGSGDERVWVVMNEWMIRKMEYPIQIGRASCRERV